MKEVSLLVYPKQVYELLGISQAKFSEIRKLPGFPKPVRPAMKRTMYVRAQIEAWVKSLEIES